ncbi:hypothetical protein PR048_009060 [Dryococelus australis]|uniref:HTH psq-type domain-containing protein n=1 Tax=Dryococelus australis TaxID=614101 RepID=A0ABQ9HYV1_9NEOP|nr:hypothetical protein PR048_009060 [Dryococelus australis]
MATSEKRSQYYSYSPSAMVEPLRAVQNNNICVREASRRLDVPKMSLQDRLCGRIGLPGDVRRMGPSPYLSTEEESNLTKWLEDLAKSGFPRKMDDLLNAV